MYEKRKNTEKCGKAERNAAEKRSPQISAFLWYGMWSRPENRTKKPKKRTRLTPMFRQVPGVLQPSEWRDSNSRLRHPKDNRFIMYSNRETIRGVSARNAVLSGHNVSIVSVCSVRGYGRVCGQEIWVRFPEETGAAESGGKDYGGVDKEYVRAVSPERRALRSFF